MSEFWCFRTLSFIYLKKKNVNTHILVQDLKSKDRNLFNCQGFGPWTGDTVALKITTDASKPRVRWYLCNVFTQEIRKSPKGRKKLFHASFLHLPGNNPPQYFKPYDLICQSWADVVLCDITPQSSCHQMPAVTTQWCWRYHSILFT